MPAVHTFINESALQIFMDSGQTYAVIRISVQKHLPPSFPADVLRNLFKLPGLALPFNLACRFSDFILVEACGVRPTTHEKFGIVFTSVHDRFLDLLVDRSFDSTHEASAHVDPTSSQRKSRSERIAICHSSRGYVWYLFAVGFSKLLPRSVEQDKIWDVMLANMTGTFESVDTEEVDAHFHGRDRMADCCAFVENDAVGGFEFGDIVFDQAGGFHDLDAFVDDDLGILTVWRRRDGG